MGDALGPGEFHHCYTVESEGTVMQDLAHFGRDGLERNCLGEVMLFRLCPGIEHDVAGFS